MKTRLATLDLALLGIGICAFSQTLGVAYVASRVTIFGQACQLMTWVGVLLAGISLVHRRASRWAWIVLPIVLLALLLQKFNNGGSVLLQGLVLILAVSSVDYKQVCRSLFIGTFAASLVVLILFFTGISDSGVGRRGGFSLGFGHPNTAGRVALIAYLLWICGYKALDNIKLSHCLLLGGIVYFVTGSRTASLLIVLTPLVILLVRKFSLRALSVVAVVVGLVPLFLFVFTYVTAQLLPVSAFVNQLDVLLSNRIFLNYYAFTNNDLTLFGQVAQLADNSGTVYNSIRNLYNWSTTVDSTYAVMLISYGVVPSILFSICAFIACRRAGKAGDVLMLVTALMLELFAFNESQMISVTNSFFLLYALTQSSPSPLETQPVNFVKAGNEPSNLQTFQIGGSA